MKPNGCDFHKNEQLLRFKHRNQKNDTDIFYACPADKKFKFRDLERQFHDFSLKVRYRHTPIVS